MKKLKWVKAEKEPGQYSETHEAKVGSMSYFINTYMHIIQYSPRILAARPDLKSNEGIFCTFDASYGPNNKPGLIPLTRLSTDGMNFDECKQACQNHYESILTA